MGASSGLNVIDIANLRVNDFTKSYDQETEITTLHIIRTKTNYEFYTFLTPEASEAVNDYITWRNRKGENWNSENQFIKNKVVSPNGYLFISCSIPDEYLTSNNEELRKSDKRALIAIYDRLNEHN